MDHMIPPGTYTAFLDNKRQMDLTLEVSLFVRGVAKYG